MYESITYAELKSLPREQKVEALKELLATHPSQKKIAEKLGVNPPNIYNMISRYVKDGTDEGIRKKKSGVKGKTASERKARVPGTRHEKISGEIAANERLADNKLLGADESFGRIEQFGGETADEKAGGRAAAFGQDRDSYAAVKRAGNRNAAVKQAGRPDKKGFLITIAKEMTGEEIGPMLAGIGSILLKNAEYRIEVKITGK
jgi:transposase-like protein